ncbi:MAG: SpoIIE family protein phosphatase [Pseudomonadales bacterium]
MRPHSKGKSLSQQLSLILIIGVSFVSLLANLFVYNLNKDQALQHFEEKNVATINQLLGTLVQPVWNINLPALQTSANNFTEDESLVFLEIYDEYDEPLLTYKSDIYDDNINFTQAAIIKEDTTIGQIKIAFSKNALDANLNNILFSNIVILLITLTTIITLCLFVFETLLKKPLDSLIASSQNFGSGNSMTTLETPYKEFKPLVDVLSIMEQKIFNQLKELNEHKRNLELQVDDRTKKLVKEKQLVNSIMDSQESIIITSDGKSVITTNRSCLDFFGLDNEPLLFDDDDIVEEPQGYIDLREKVEDEEWLNHIYLNRDQIHKIDIHKDDKNYIFSISIDRFTFESAELYTVVFNDITELENIRDEIEALHTHTRQSIEYSALIQGTLIPASNRLEPYFNQHFVTWQPKDLVGGDIYLFDELRGPHECLFMIIDCTGHGVPGAFMTMLVKAIEKQIVTSIKASNQPVDTSQILKQFNQEIKSTLKQDRNSTLSNAGFDGGILYFNKREQVIRYSGANIPLYYVEEGELSVIKGDRHSVGYKTSDADYNFTEHTLKVTPGTSLYLNTDGYADQNGGAKGFPFGRRRFENLVREHFEKPMKSQQEIFIDELLRYQGGEERNDDVTMMALKI